MDMEYGQKERHLREAGAAPLRVGEERPMVCYEQRREAKHKEGVRPGAFVRKENGERPRPMPQPVCSEPGFMPQPCFDGSVIQRRLKVKEGAGGQLSEEIPAERVKRDCSKSVAISCKGGKIDVGHVIHVLEKLAEEEEKLYVFDPTNLTVTGPDRPVVPISAYFGQFPQPVKPVKVIPEQTFYEEVVQGGGYISMLPGAKTVEIWRLTPGQIKKQMELRGICDINSSISSESGVDANMIIEAPNFLIEIHPKGGVHYGAYFMITARGKRWKHVFSKRSTYLAQEPERATTHHFARDDDSVNSDLRVDFMRRTHTRKNFPVIFERMSSLPAMVVAKKKTMVSEGLWDLEMEESVDRMRSAISTHRLRPVRRAVEEHDIDQTLELLDRHMQYIDRRLMEMQQAPPAQTARELGKGFRELGRILDGIGGQLEILGAVVGELDREIESLRERAALHERQIPEQQ